MSTPDVFSDPRQVDLTRRLTRRNVGEHLVFGHGPDIKDIEDVVDVAGQVVLGGLRRLVLRR